MSAFRGLIFILFIYALACFAEQAGPRFSGPVQAEVAPETTMARRGSAPQEADFFSRPVKMFTVMEPFEKWRNMLGRMDGDQSGQAFWRRHAAALKGTEPEMIAAVNRIANRYIYRTDAQNYGVSDYWAAPHEFDMNGGDCEDYAIFKYGWLRFLGVPENRLRIVIVSDLSRGGQMHAVLAVQSGLSWLVLDNQRPHIGDSQHTGRYRLVYAINRQGWWYPEPQHLTVASLGSGGAAGGTGQDIFRGVDEDRLAAYLNALPLH